MFWNLISLMVHTRLIDLRAEYWLLATWKRSNLPTISSDTTAIPGTCINICKEIWRCNTSERKELTNGILITNYKDTHQSTYRPINLFTYLLKLNVVTCGWGHVWNGPINGRRPCLLHELFQSAKKYSEMLNFNILSMKNINQNINCDDMIWD